MLTGVIGELVNGYLEDVNHDAIEIDLRDGTCVLNDCRIKNSAWRPLGLPFEIVSADIKRLELKFDWKWTTFESNVSLEVNGIDVVAAPFTDEETANFDLEKAYESLVQFKRNCVRDQLGKAVKLTAGNEKKSWATRMVAKLIEGASVSLYNVSFKFLDRFGLYEDASLGIRCTIGSVSMETIQKDGALESTVHKTISISGIEIDTNESSDFEFNTSPIFQLVRSFSVEIGVSLDPFCYNLTTLDPSVRVDLQGGKLWICDLSPELIHGLYVIVESWCNFEGFLLRKTDPAPSREATGIARQRWHWAIRRIRKQLDSRNLWYSTSFELVRHSMVERYFKSSALGLVEYVHNFEKNCPTELLVEYHISAKGKGNTTDQGGWRQWVLQITDTEEFKQSQFVHGNTLKPSTGQFQRVVRCSLDAVEITIMDSHAFQIASLECGMSIIFFENETNSRVDFNLDTLRLKNEAQTELMKARKLTRGDLFYGSDGEASVTYHSDDDDEAFFDAEEDDLLATMDHCLNKNAPLRVSLESSKDDKRKVLTLIVEPLEIRWDSETMGHVLSFLSILAKLVNSSAPMKELRDYAKEMTPRVTAEVKVRIGAPCIAFQNASGTEIICIVDLGHITLQTVPNEDNVYQVLSQGFEVLTLDSSAPNQGEIFNFGDEALTVRPIFHSIEVEGVLSLRESNTWSSDFKIGGSSNIHVAVSSNNCKALMSIISNARATASILKLATMSQSVQLAKFERERIKMTMLMDLSVQTVTIGIYDENTSLVSTVRCGHSTYNARYELHTNPLKSRSIIKATFENLLVRSEEETKNILVQLDNICMNFDDRTWTVGCPAVVSMCWVPPTISKIVSIFENSGFNRELENFSSMVQSRMFITPTKNEEKTDVCFQVAGVQLRMLKGYESFVDISVGEVSGVLSIFDSASYHFEINLNTFALDDLRNNILLYENACALSYQGTIKIQFDKNRGSKPILQMDCVSALQVVLWQPFIMECVDYVTNGVLGAILLRQSSSTSTPDLIEKRIQLGSIKVQIPATPGTRHPHLVLSIAKVSSNNQFSSEFDCMHFYLHKPCLSVNEVDFLIRHPGFSVELHKPIFPNSGCARILATVKDIYVKITSVSVGVAFFNCVKKNLLSNENFLEALFLQEHNDEKNPIRYWQSLIHSKEKGQIVEVCLSNVSFAIGDCGTLYFEQVNVVQNVRFNQAVQGFAQDNEYRIQGLKLCDPLGEAQLVGSLREFSEFYDDNDQVPMQVFLQIRYDPLEGSKSLWHVTFSVDHACVSIRDIKHLARYGVFLQSIVSGLDLEPVPDTEESSFLLPSFPNKQLTVNVEASDLHVLVISENSKNCVEVVSSIFGEATSMSVGDERKMEKGCLHMNIRVNFRECICQEPDTGKDVMMMTMTQSMLSSTFAQMNDRAHSKSRSISTTMVKPFTLELSWDMPFEGKDLIKQICVQLTSDVDCVFAIHWAQVFATFLQSSTHTAMLDDNHYLNEFEVTFPTGPLGLKLGPNANLLEVRGFGKQCDEHITKQVLPGDVLVAVNSQSLLDCQCIDEIKDMIRVATWPKTIRFSRSNPQPKLDPVLYVPVSKTTWQCRNCKTLQPIQKRVIFENVTCARCNAYHVKPLENNIQSDMEEDSVVVGTIKQDEIFENQRFYMLVGWSSNLVVTDPYPWSDCTGRVVGSMESSTPRSPLPNAKWIWMENWMIDHSIGDNDGWEYSIDFSAFDNLSSTPTRKSPKRMDCVRRRRWVRHRVLQDLNNNDTEDLKRMVPKQDVVTRVADSEQGHPPYESQYSFQFETNGNRFSMTLLDERISTPLLRAYLDHGNQCGFRAMYTNSSDTTFRNMLRIAGNVVMRVDYFNFRVVDWEPLLEPWAFAFEVQREIVCGWHFTLLGINRLCLNISRGGLELLTRVVELVQVDGAELTASNIPHLATLSNWCGATLMCKLSSNDAVLEIENGKSVPMSPLKSIYSWNTNQEYISVTLFGGWKTLSKLRLGDDAKRSCIAYAIGKTGPSGESGNVYGKIVVQIELVNGCRVMEIGSTYRIYNYTSVQLSLHLGQPSGQGGVLLLGVCGPNGGQVALPVLPDIHSRTLHIYSKTAVAGNSEEYTIGLSGLNELVQTKCKVNLARAVASDGIVVDSFLTKISKNMFVFVRIRAEAIEKCYSADRTSSTVNTRSIVGSKYSNYLVYIELCCPVSFKNSLPHEVCVRIKAASNKQYHYSILPGEYWNVHFIEESIIRCSICVPFVSEEHWSEWFTLNITSSSLPLTSQCRIEDSHSRAVHLPFHMDSSKESALNVTFGPCIFVHDYTKMALQIGVLNGKTGSIQALPGQASVSTIVVAKDNTKMMVPTIQPSSGWKWAEPEWRLSADGKSFVRFSVRVSDKFESRASDVMLGVNVTGLTVRIGRGPWAETISMGVAEVARYVLLDVADPESVAPNAVIPLVIYIPDPKSNDWEISLRHRYLIINELDSDIFLEQCSSNITANQEFELGPLSLCLKAKQRVYFYWKDKNEDRFLRIAKEIDEGFLWTGRVDPSIVDDFALLLRRPRDLTRELVNVSISECPHSKMLVIRLSPYVYPSLYRIENRTLHVLECAQVCNYSKGIVPIVIKDLRSCPFGWDEMVKTTEPLLRIRVADMDQDTDGLKVLAYEDLESPAVVVDIFLDIGAGKRDMEPAFNPETSLQVRVYSEGVTRVVSVSHSWAFVDPPPFIREKMTCNIVCEFAEGATISFVDTCELFCLHIMSTTIELAKTDILDKFHLAVQSLQIDDAHYHSTLPTVLSPIAPVETTFLDIIASRYACETNHFKYLSLKVGDFEFKLGKAQFKPFIAFLETIRKRISDVLPKRSETKASLFSFDLIYLHDVNIRLTLTSSGRATTPMSVLEESAETNVSKDKVSALDVVSAALTRVADIESTRMPYWALALDHILRGDLHNENVHLDALALSHIKITGASCPPLVQHYKKQVARELASTALVSSQVLAQPLHIIRYIGNAIKQGSATSLRAGAKQVLGGTAIMSEAMFRGLARGLATMSMSNEYVIRRRERAERQTGSNDTRHVFSRGLELMKDGVSEGVVGLVSEPYRGAKDSGPVGLIGGLGKGMAGVAIKPMVGVIDAATMASTALHTSSEVVESQQTLRLRKPRAMYGTLCKLGLYDEQDADICQLLAQIDHMRYAHDMFYGQHEYPTESTIYIFTDKRILCVRNRESVDWAITIQNLISFSVNASDQQGQWGVHISSNRTSSSEISYQYIRCGEDKRKATEILQIIETITKNVAGSMS
mmetsp:Transcript_7806/g.14411  ORF Transcript_7806/g.14411 Transcript_7806/m.14411 type:complete len:3261 (-) Transcript_7806:5395-15177(-)|eukprot:CAMPEP_0203763180 /NCGR_PEP_ID=MMETSP0098-20131031/15832_1 /ASSEMBLY_ACC=CAM_ASM_000208 /TAXON_ID=96639 /ORGANISM=" , Strain NY0313808BC1" /LENGTH=3260 /DNA_ID=CAMNT_0050657789 /DNA_START=433 /DNA_END=10215 /DNA_ORIENTATION=+